MDRFIITDYHKRTNSTIQRLNTVAHLPWYHYCHICQELMGLAYKQSPRVISFVWINRFVAFSCRKNTGPIFIRPFEKRDVLCRGNVRPSVRLSVCPSVRPRFPDFSSTCFEISIWNLVYAFSRWHDMSSVSCITIGSLWPSLQPKVGQTYFLQSWPHKSR